MLAECNAEHGGGLGKTRWIVKRSLAWLHQFRRLRLRWERLAHVYQAFVILGCILICWSPLQGGF